MRALRLLLLALPLCACIELDEFPEESVVTGPRILAVVTDPPEVTPGAALSISVLVAEAEEVEVEYSVCGAFDGPFGGMQFGEMDDEDCSDDALLRGDGSTWEPPREIIDLLWANRELAEAILGGTLPRESIETVLSSVGVPLLVDIAVRADGRELRAVKRVLLSENPNPHTNPPPPAFEFDDIAVRADPNTPWSCTSEEPLVARPREDIEIAPATVDGEEDWVEQYKVINARGEIEDRTERAFYSWFATGGDFDRHVTRSPLRNQIWTAPAEPGRYRLWLVVRDGHGGSSACGIDVRVRR
jgi:hypothetical protein